MICVGTIKMGILYFCLPLQASQFLKSLTSVESPEPVDTVVQELQQKIEAVQEATKGNHKTAKVR